MKEKQGAGGKGSKATKIDQSEITVVLQGSTLPEYGGKRCIELSALSVRKTMPHCKIIISTWEGEDIPQSVRGAVDKVIFNKDPGCFVRGNEKPNNVNRQLVSSLNGLKQAQTKYALKMRTDFVMKSTDFLNYFDVYNSFSESYRLFQKRLVCGMTNFTKRGVAFYISDFLNFGLTSDLLKLYDIPLADAEYFTWFDSHKELRTEKQKSSNRYDAEQFIPISCLRKYGVDVKCQYKLHLNDEIRQQGQEYMVNNYYPVRFEKLGILPLKVYLKTKNSLYWAFSWYTQRDWLKIYKKYCDNNIRLPLFDWERAHLTIWYFIIPFPKKMIRKLVKLIVGETRYQWLKVKLKRGKSA